MGCMMCPGSGNGPTLSSVGTNTGKAHTFRVRVENATQEAEYRQKYSDYRVQRQVMSANSIILVFTRT